MVVALVLAAVVVVVILALEELFPDVKGPAAAVGIRQL
jgi:hypothetical protein